MENSGILKAEIKSILAMKAKEGATYSEIRDEYCYLMGKELCISSSEQFSAFMKNMPDVRGGKTWDGRVVWFTRSEKTRHIIEMVKNQKVQREHVNFNRTNVLYNPSSTCYYNDNYLYKNQRKCKSESNSSERKYIRKDALFDSYEFIGDDFFLNIAHLDCKRAIEYSGHGYKGRSIKKCGLCVSGQYIKDVTKRLKTNVQLSNRIILNIGSVDLLHGRDFMDIKQDFIELYSVFERRGIQPVVTTLAPLANMCYSKDIQMRLSAFNAFLINNFSNHLDVACCFLTDNQKVIFDHYQHLPKFVSGSTKPHSLWNYSGRQRVINYLKAGLDELSYRNLVFKNNLPSR